MTLNIITDIKTKKEKKNLKKNNKECSTKKLTLF